MAGNGMNKTIRPGTCTDHIGTLPGRQVDNNVIAFLTRHGQDIPDRPALLWLPPATPRQWLADPATPLVHEQISYGQLRQGTSALAKGLHDLGVRAGDRVFVFIPMSPQLYLAMFAVQQLGAIAVFLDSWARADQLGLCIGQVQPRAFIAPEAALQAIGKVPNLPTTALLVVVGSHQQPYAASLDELAASGQQAPICPVEPDDTALVTFTTGSSGPPKGANRTHRFLAAQHRALDLTLPYRPEDIDLPVFPIFSLNNIAGGVTTVLPAIDLAAPADRDGGLLAAQIEATRATCCTLSPSLLRGVAAASRERPLLGLRRTATGGAPISSDDVAAFANAAPHAELHVLYGSTEVEPIAHLLGRDMPAETAGEGVCVGQLCAGLQGKLIRVHRGPIVLGPNGWHDWESAVPGEAGELVVCGEHVCRDYYRNPGAVAASKIVDQAGQVWHRTGDLCRLDPQGRLWIVGRVHNAICRQGQLLFPVKPEVIMKRLAFVAAAAYVGQPDAKLGERAVAAYAVRRNADAGSLADRREAIRQALLAAQVVVDAIVELPTIPLDPRHHSKVEYDRLRQLLASEP